MPRILLLFLIALIVGIAIVVFMEEDQGGEQPRTPAQLPAADDASRGAAGEVPPTGLATPLATAAFGERRNLPLPRILVLTPHGRRASGATVSWYQEGPDRSVTPCRGYGLTPSVTGDPDHEVIADEEGVAAWPTEARDGRWVVVAAAGGLTATAVSDLDARTATHSDRESDAPPTIRLTLQPFQDLDVRVVDENSQPVPDALVAVCALGAKTMAWQWDGADQSDRFASFRTDAEGRAAVRLPRGGRATNFEDTGRLRFHVLSLGAEPFHRDVTEEAFGRPIILKTSGLCRAHLRVRGLPSGPDLARTRLILTEDDPLALHPLTGSSVAQPKTQLLEEAASSVLKTWGIPRPPKQQHLAAFRRGTTVGWTLRVPGREPSRGQWQIPDAPEVHLEATIGEPLVTYTMTVQDAAGQPALADWYEIFPLELRMARQPSSTPGRWTFRLPASAPETLHILAQRGLTLRRDGTVRLPETPAASVQLAGGSPGQYVDLGTITLALPPLVVSGQVVQEDGRPAGPLQLHVHGLSDQPGQPSPTAIRMPKRIPVHADGTFELRSWPIHGQPIASVPLALRAQDGPWTSGLIPFEFGSAVIVPVRRSGAIAGTVLLAAGVHDIATFVLSSEDQNFHRTIPLIGTGHFEADGLLAGSYSATLSFHDEVFLRWEDIVVVSAETTHPVGLEALDLRQRFRMESVRVLSPEGDPLPKISVVVDHEVRPARNETWNSPRTDAEGEAQVLIDHQRVSHLLVAPPRYERDSPYGVQHIVHPRFPLTVTLQSKPVVLLVFDRPLPSPATGHIGLFLSRRLDAAEQARNERDLEELRAKGWAPGRRLRLQLTHDHHAGELIASLWGRTPTLRFQGELTTGLYELRVFFRGESLEGPVLESITLGTIDVQHGEQTVRWPLTEGQLAQIRRLIGQ